MTGIRELFAELSGDDPDWFQMAFWFERRREIRLERQRESQRNYDLRTHGKRRKRGRPSLGLTPEQMRERKRKQNLAAQLKWQATHPEQLRLNYKRKRAEREAV